MIREVGFRVLRFASFEDSSEVTRCRISGHAKVEGVFLSPNENGTFVGESLRTLQRRFKTKRTRSPLKRRRVLSPP